MLGAGIVTAATMAVVGQQQPEVAWPSVAPLVWPAVSGLALAGVLAGALPAVLAPPPPQLADSEAQARQAVPA